MSDVSSPHDGAVALEARAARDWPAVQHVGLGGWQARVSGGVTRRANSVRAIAPVADVEASISAVEKLYDEVGLASCIQIWPHSVPADLDQRLDDRGYALVGSAEALVSPTNEALERLAATEGPRESGNLRVDVGRAPSPGWLAVWGDIGGYDAEQQTEVRRICVGIPAAYVSVAPAEDPTAPPLAVGRIVLSGDQASLWCFGVHADHRGQGVGNFLLGEALAWSKQRGATGCSVLVARDNDPARGLYAAAGFTRVGTYHYRERRAAPSSLASRS